MGSPHSRHTFFSWVRSANMKPKVAFVHEKAPSVPGGGCTFLGMADLFRGLRALFSCVLGRLLWLGGRSSILHFSMLGKALLEFVHTSSGIDQHHLTRVEGMGCAADIELDQGVLVTVLPHHGILGVRTALAEEHVVIAHVLEDDDAVVLGMDALFHQWSALRYCRPDSDERGANVRKYPIQITPGL